MTRRAPRRFAAWLLLVATFVILTLLTQIGGVILVVVLLIDRCAFRAALRGWRRAAAGVALFASLHAAVSIFALPPLAAAWAGRVALPCRAEPGRPFAAANLVYCAFNRHYVDARLVALLTEMSRSIDGAFPGTTTLFLDANFPFFNSFPLLPHLSHGDGRKLDIAYYYVGPDQSYLPGATRSPLGYFAFEQAPTASAPLCPERWLTLRWDLNAMQRLFPDRPMDSARTRLALLWLTTEGQKFGIERIFIEPHLATRLGIDSPLIGFQGCRAARHDDHFHIQIRPAGASGRYERPMMVESAAGTYDSLAAWLGGMLSRCR